MRARLLAAVGPALLWAAASGGQAQPAWEPVRGSGFSGVPLALVPVGDPKKDNLPDPKAVWAGLPEGMAKDADTQKLLKKLLNCQTVELAVPPKDADGKFRPAAPTGKSQVYIGVRLSEPTVGEKAFMGCVLGTATHLAYEVPDTRQWDEKATAWRAFVIAANEYLYRTKKGYHLHHGLLVEPGDLDLDDERIRDPLNRGKYLQKQIAEYLDRYKP